jgi:excisionase family DNA binding protein
MKNFYTLAEVAEKLNVSKQTLRNWDNSNKLVASKTLGKHRRYLKSAIHEIMKTMGVEE